MKTKSIFGDYRLDRAYENLITDMSATGSAVINRACTSAASKKEAYRFINNENVTVAAIEKTLINQTVDNVQKMELTEVLVAQDTMEIVRDSLIGRLKKKNRTVLECARSNKGMRSHSAIVMNSETGVPAGIAYLKIWGRKPRPIAEVREEDLRADRRYQPSYYMTDPESGKMRYKYFVPVSERESESACWIDAIRQIRNALPPKVHVIMLQDREGDMYPLLTLPGELDNLDIVVRASKKRVVILPAGKTRDMFEYTSSTGVRHTYTISIKQGPRKKARKAEVELRYGKITIRRPHLPVYPQKTLELNFVRVTEKNSPKGVGTERIDWLLLTSINIDNLDDALKIVSYYRRRWFIEDFHRLLKKKGFGIEDIQVEDPHAFEINLAVCIKSAYEVALVKKGFDSMDETIPASIAFTPLELKIVSNINTRYNPEKKIHKNPFALGSLAWAAWAVACEGGWSAMPSQPKPGIITFKRGIDKIETIYQYLLDTPLKPICG